MVVLPVFGGFEYYVWDTKIYDWVQVSRREFNKLQRSGRDVIFFKKSKRAVNDAIR